MTDPKENSAGVSSPAVGSGPADEQIAHDAKLKLDAENVLTWDTPSGGDILMFGHLRRFAKEVLRLLAQASGGGTPRSREQLAKVERDVLVQVIAPRLNHVPALDTSASHRRELHAGQIADAILHTFGTLAHPSDSRETPKRRPLDFEEFRKSLHANYSGGHHDDGHYDAFHQGMDIVVNVIAAKGSPWRAGATDSRETLERAAQVCEALGAERRAEAVEFSNRDRHRELYRLLVTEARACEECARRIRGVASLSPVSTAATPEVPHAG